MYDVWLYRHCLPLHFLQSCFAITVRDINACVCVWAHVWLFRLEWETGTDTNMSSSAEAWYKEISLTERAGELCRPGENLLEIRVGLQREKTKGEKEGRNSSIIYKVQHPVDRGGSSCDFSGGKFTKKNKKRVTVKTNSTKLVHDSIIC